MQKKVTVKEWVMEPECEQAETPSSVFLKGSERKELCHLMHDLCMDFQVKPQLVLPQNTCDLWVLFPETGLDCSRFYEIYGERLAWLSSAYTISICGFCQPLEEGQLLMQPTVPAAKQYSVTCSKKNMTGKEFDLLFSACFKITFPTCKEKLFVYEVLQGISPERSTAVVNGRWADVFSQEGLFEPTERSHFRYLQFGACEDPQKEWMEALSLGQMRELWTVFLTSRQDTLEFEWLYTQMAARSQRHLYELELALEWTLLDLQIRVDHENGQFLVTDREGERLRFDFGSHIYGEKLFLKLIFPVKP